MQPFYQHRHILLVMLGVLIITPDSLTIRLLEIDDFSIVFWRSIIAGSLILGVYFFKSFYPRQKQSSFKQVLKKDYYKLWLIWLVMPLGNLLFVFGTNYNSVSSNLALLAASPIFGVLLSWFFLKEKVSRATLIAIAGVFVGIIIVIKGDFLSGNAIGSIIGLTNAVLLAGYFTILNKYKDVNVSMAVGSSLIITAIFAAFFAEFPTLNEFQWIIIIINGTLISTLSYLFISASSKHVPPRGSMFDFFNRNPFRSSFGMDWYW